MLMLTQWDGTKFTIPAETVVSCNDQCQHSAVDKNAPSYWLRQSDGQNWRIKESPEEIFQMMQR